MSMSEALPIVSADAMLRLILNSRVYDVAHETPLDRAQRLSRRLGNDVRLKRGEVDAIFVPVGGGGLIAGIASYVKALRPAVEVIGVEPYEADAMYQSLAMGRRVMLDRVGIFADGVAVQEVGRLTFPIVQSTVREVVRVSNDEICAAIKDIFDDTRSIMEPAGALAVAGLSAWVERTGTRKARLAAILSGANINFDRLRFV